MTLRHGEDRPERGRAATRVIGVAVALVLACAGVARAQVWIDFTSKEDAFAANFPGQPTVTQTTYRSQMGADLPARDYSASQGASRFLLRVVDYNPIERLLTEKSKSCPEGAETCKGNPSPRSSTGLGYWKVDLAGAMTYATWQYLQRDARVTQFIWTNVDKIEGQLLNLTNADQSRTYVAIFMHKNKLYVSEATVPAGFPEPGIFEDSLVFLDENGKPLRYETLYHNGFPDAWAPAHGLP